jgi:RNA polymerase sigma-70 factor (ECF subfamily)
MLPALSVLVRPSRTHRVLLAMGGLVLCAVAVAVGADPVHYLGAPAVALAPALAATVLLGSAARRPKTHRIDISGTGDLRVTVQQGVGPPGGATFRNRDDTPVRLLPGSVVWPLLMVLRYGAADAGACVLIVGHRPARRVRKSGPGARKNTMNLLQRPNSISSGDAAAANGACSVTTERESDQLLVERVQAGDRRAFDLLVAKYQRRLMRLVSRLVHDPAEAEDVVQETFIKAFRALRHFRGDSAFYTWLYRIGINTAKNFLVTQGRRAPTSTEADAERAEGFDDADSLRDINTPESVLASKQIAYTVNAAMEALPLELRTAIVLREIEGLSYEEISEVMACPIGTVRSRIFRAREVIAEKLRPLLDISADKRR